jgi:hypothetical protein
MEIVDMVVVLRARLLGVGRGMTLLGRREPVSSVGKLMSAFRSRHWRSGTAFGTTIRRSKQTETLKFGSAD